MRESRLKVANPFQAAWIVKEVYHKLCYTPQGSGVVLPTQPNATIVDCGANVGVFTLWVCALLSLNICTYLFATVSECSILIRNRSAGKQ